MGGIGEKETDRKKEGEIEREGREREGIRKREKEERKGRERRKREKGRYELEITSYIKQE